MTYRCLCLRISLLLELPTRIRHVFTTYMIFLIIGKGKRTLTNAADLMEYDISNFSKLLLNHFGTAELCLELLSKSFAKKMAKSKKSLANIKRWGIIIIIDSTFQHRCSLKPGNSNKFNHGRGYEIGHQWTNIVLVVGGIVIPLQPICYYSRDYCRKNEIDYKTEHDYIIEYFTSLNLKDYVCKHKSESVLFLADSGYDNKKIQDLIQSKSWCFVAALKCSRGVKSKSQYEKDNTGKITYSLSRRGFEYFKKIGITVEIREKFKTIKKRLSKEVFIEKLTTIANHEFEKKIITQILKLSNEKSWGRIDDFFNNHSEIKWYTISIAKNTEKEKRMDFRVKQATVHLQGVGELKVLCSEIKKSSNNRKKFLACNNMDATAHEIICAYRLRWKIEIFHKQVKMQLGFEDISAKNFASVMTHTYMVYCAYILLDLLSEQDEEAGVPEKTMQEKKAKIECIFESVKKKEFLRMLTLFGGVKLCRNKIKEELHKMAS